MGDLPLPVSLDLQIEGIPWNIDIWRWDEVSEKVHLIFFFFPIDYKWVGMIHSPRQVS